MTWVYPAHAASLKAIDRARERLAKPGLIADLPWLDFYDSTRALAGHAPDDPDRIPALNNLATANHPEVVEYCLQPLASERLSDALQQELAVQFGDMAECGRNAVHLGCREPGQLEKNAGPAPEPEYMRADLARLIDGTPVPEELHRRQYSSWTWPAQPRIEYVIALYIAIGRVAADPRCGDPVSRLRDAAARQFGDHADAAIQ